VFDVSRELFDAGVIVELTRAGVPANRGHFIVNTRFDLSESPHTFDWAIAHSLVDRLEPNQLGPCIAGVLGKLAPGGAFALASGRAGADTITRLAESLGASCERITDANHPRGEDVLILRK
jgi:hypothetical protein